MKRVFHHADESRGRRTQGTQGWEKYCYAGEGAGFFMASLLTSGPKESM